MLTAPALSTAVPASAEDRETACRGQTAHLVEKGFRPMNGLRPGRGRPAGVVAVTAIRPLLLRISGSTQLGFGDYLRDLFDDLAAMSGRSGGPNSPVRRPTRPFRLARRSLSGSSPTCSSPTRSSMRSRPGEAAVSPCPSQPSGRPQLLTVEDGGIAMRAVIAGARMA